MKIVKNKIDLFSNNDKKNESSLKIKSPSKPISYDAIKEKSDRTLTPLNLYEYGMGIKEIEASFIQYGEKQVFVTKPIEIPGNVMEVQLDSNESHPVFDNVSGKTSDRQTSIEYSLSFQDKPGLLDWIPILPKNQTLIKSERLLIKNQIGILRFPSNMPTLKVYENGLLLEKDEYVIVSNLEIKINDYQSSSSYTVDYVPDTFISDPWTFKTDEHATQLVTITERFPKGTAFNKTITLSHDPYVDLNKIVKEDNYNPNTSEYKPIKVKIEEASIQGRNNVVLKTIEPYKEDLLNTSYTYNKTLYKNKSWSQLRDYDLDPNDYYGGFDYYHHKNKLTFTEHFNASQIRENLKYSHGKGEIVVTYQTIITSFRLKAILRRNALEETTATPFLNNFNLHFKTMN